MDTAWFWLSLETESVNHQFISWICCNRNRVPSNEMGARPSRELVEPILHHSEELLSMTIVQVYADEGEQTMKNSAPPVNNVIEIASLMGPRISATPDQFVAHSCALERNMVLSKVNLDTMTMTLFERAIHLLAHQIPALMV